MKVGLALSGGGIRSVAHLGMMEALEEEHVNFSAISGASAGALLGAFYCAGHSPREILAIVQSFNFLKQFRPAFTRRGILNIERVTIELKELIGHDDFKKLKTPLTVVATDIKEGEVEYFHEGELIKPILGSCSIPVIFNPIEINKALYVDGGLLDNLPVGPLKDKCEVTIGLHCNPIENDVVPTSWKSMMERSLLIAISSATYKNRNFCDLFWEPVGLSKYKVFDYKKSEEIFDLGYRYARDQMKDVQTRKLLNVV